MDGSGGGRFETASTLAKAVAGAWPNNRFGRRFVVCTGGEPLLQLNRGIIDALHEQQFEIAIETNGTIPAPNGIDWVCVSPKTGSELQIFAGDELKLIFPQVGAEPERFENLKFRHRFLQPMYGPHLEKNTQAAIAYCLANPGWRLSLQIHKIIGIR